jgi:hypothetical protein
MDEPTEKETAMKPPLDFDTIRLRLQSAVETLEQTIDFYSETEQAWREHADMMLGPEGRTLEELTATCIFAACESEFETLIEGRPEISAVAELVAASPLASRILSKARNSCLCFVPRADVDERREQFDRLVYEQLEDGINQMAGWAGEGE